MRLSAICSVLLACGLGSGSLLASEAADISGITTWSTAELAFMQQSRRDSPGGSMCWVGPDVGAAAQAYLPLVRQQDHAGIARRVLSVYPTPGRSTAAISWWRPARLACEARPRAPKEFPDERSGRWERVALRRTGRSSAPVAFSIHAASC